eukprot:g46198.t1
MCRRSTLDLCRKILRCRPATSRKRSALKSCEVKLGSSPACRTLSTERGRGPSGAGAGGLAHAILQEKLQQQERAKEEAGSGEPGAGSSDTGADQEQKQKQNAAYAKKMVLRLAGLLGAGSAFAVVYVFGRVWYNTYLSFVADQETFLPCVTKIFRLLINLCGCFMIPVLWPLCPKVGLDLEFLARSVLFYLDPEIRLQFP